MDETQQVAGGTPAPGTFTVRKGQQIKSTLGEHGQGTLIGTLPGGISFVPLDLHYRAEVGRRVESDPMLSNYVGRRVIRALALSLEAFGGHDWPGMTLPQREAAVGQIHIGDTMYLAFARLAQEYPDGWLRPLPVDRCPHCKGRVPRRVTVDLKTIPVEGWDSRPEIVYRMQRPWRIAGLDAETVTISAGRLSLAMAPLTDDEFGNELIQRIAWLAASITQINGQPMTVSREMIEARDPVTGRSISSEDFDEMTEIVDMANGGPQQGVMWEHPECGKAIPVSIPWGKGFFVHSGA